MTEFVLALPLLLTVLTLMFLVGWLHMRKQRVVVASRYAVWRSFDGGDTSSDAIRERLLNNRPHTVELTPMHGSVVATLPGWIAAAGDVGASTGVLADELIWRSWPLDRQTRVEAFYDPPLRIGERFGNDLSFRHARAGQEWVHGEAHEWSVLRDIYYADLEADLDSYSGSGQDMANRIRSLYRGW